MEKIIVQLVIEILGRPKEHVLESLKEIVNRLSKEPGITLLESDFHEPALVKDSKELYTSFAQVTVELESIGKYFAIIFGYFPAHIELISPENLKISNGLLNEVGNSLAIRLHDYDALAKRIVNDNSILENMLKTHAPHVFKEPQKELQVKPLEKNPEKEKPAPIETSSKKSRKKKKI
jgi:hypothetical protein